MKCVALLLVFFVSVCCSDSSLELVHVFFRHGSRTPEEYETYPSDTHTTNDFYPIGYGQLTNRGKEMAYQLGKILRERYKEFLGELYTADIVRTQSTDVERTKMSALLVLAGLFPPSSSQVWDEELKWLPIPYHYVTGNKDYVLKRPNRYCPVYVKELEQALQSDVVKKMLREHNTTLEYLTKHTGKPVNTLEDVFLAYQVLLAESTMNLTLPTWADAVYPEPMKKLATQQCVSENFTPTMRRLFGGRILKKVIENMISKSKNTLTPPGRKLFMYSGHEYNVINILATLNLYNPPQFPSYSSAVMLELHRTNTTNKYFVKLFYLKNIENEPEELFLPKCGDVCHLDKFLDIVQPLTPENYTQECESPILLD